jgi:hypothetical protein
MNPMPPDPAGVCAPRGFAFEPFLGKILDTVIVEGSRR